MSLQIELKTKKPRTKGDPCLAVGYLRVSTEEQHHGPKAQQDAIESFAKAQGLTVVTWCFDWGVSGASVPFERQGLSEALRTVEAGEAGTVLVAKRDRLARDTLFAAMLDRWAENTGARILSADGAGNGSDPSAVLLRGILDGVAQFERSQIRGRTKAGLAAKARRSERVGQIGYGYQLCADRVHLEHNEIEQQIISEIHARRSEGYSITGIVRWLEKNGVPPRGKRWHRTTVHRILKKEKVCEDSGLNV